MEDVKNTNNQISDENIDKMVKTIEKLYLKKTQKTEKKLTLKKFYINNCENYLDTLSYSTSRGTISNKQNATLSYTHLTPEEKDKIKKDFECSEYANEVKQ